MGSFTLLRRGVRAASCSAQLAAPPLRAARRFANFSPTNGRPFFASGAKVSSPLQSMRPPAPPSAAGAQPFGVLKRSHRPHNYVNVNRVGAAPAAASQPSEAPSSPAAAPAARMELSRLLRRHDLRPPPTSAAASPAAAPAGAATVAKAKAAITSSSSAAAAVAGSQAASRDTTAASTSRDEQPRSPLDAAVEATSTAQKVYRERCLLGWTPEQLYHVVADVQHYRDFLPWCLDSQLLPGTPVELAGEQCGGELLATLTVGFSFFKEQYTSRVTLVPGKRITAVLHDRRDDDAAAPAPPAGGGLLTYLRQAAAHTAGAVARKTALRNLMCEWSFAPVPGRPLAVDVAFGVAFEFRSALHTNLIMTNVVALMTRSFERRCEELYGPPSEPSRALPPPPLHASFSNSSL